ncbi:MAG: biotin/lipoyl-binding protein [Alphaproteobacteria bacterium]|nr:biotin/lipoyl-binding protein [Alphaproteobacteria bacterium]
MAIIEVRSEITGKVWRLDASMGEMLGEEAPIMTLESMKMEIPVLAPVAGRLKELLVAEGEPVKEGQVVARLET